MTESLERTRIDSFPTHKLAGFNVRAGRSFPLGGTIVPGGVNFSIFSSGATAVTLVLFRRGEPVPMARIPIPEGFRVGGVWSILVFDLDFENIEYGYQVTGPQLPQAGDRYDADKILCDPYARVIAGRDLWGEEPDYGNAYPYRARIGFEDFDWEDDSPLRVPIEDLVIYELGSPGTPRRGSPSPGPTRAWWTRFPT